MFSNLEKFSSVIKSQFESQFATFSALASKAVEGAGKAAALNIATFKAYAEESNVAAKQLLSANEPQDFFALANVQSKLNADKAATYGRQLTEIVSGINADFTKAAEAQIADANGKFKVLVDEVIKKAPAGSENAVEMLKSVISNANAGFEQVTKAHKQNVETVKAHVAKVTDQMSQAVKQTA